MLFGKSKLEEVRPDGLCLLLNSLFEKKLGNFPDRADGIGRQMLKSSAEFSEACDRLEKLDAEPYVENIYFKTVGSIKSQKYPYVKALRDIIAENSLETGEAPNSYEQYTDLLARAEKMTGEVLKANAEFKLILYCYGNYMGTFRKSFSDIERCRESLRREIGSRSKEHSEFSSVNSWVSRLAAQREEQATMGRSMDLAKESLGVINKKVLEKDEAVLVKKLEGIRFELSVVDTEAERLSARISLLTAPLERQARKMDHGSLGKGRLHPMMADPMGEIKSEGEYLEFKTLVKKLREDVEKESIDAKNKAGTLESISALINSDLYGMVQSLKSLRQKKFEMENEARIVEGVLGDVKEGKGSSEKTVRDIASMEEKLKGTGVSISAAKQMIEKLFLEYYRKPISIIL